MINLVSYGIGSGGAVGNLLFQLENMGFFSYVLPFLMIFAVIYAILSKSGFLGKNNAINVVIALAVGLMSLQFNFVPYFFAEIFPRMGVLLAIILIAIILLSLFLDFKKKGTKFAVGTISFIGFVIILFQSFGGMWGFGFGYGFPFFGNFGWYLEQNLGWVVLIITAVIIFAIAKKPKEGKKSKEKYLKIADKFSSDED